MADDLPPPEPSPPGGPDSSSLHLRVRREAAGLGHRLSGLGAWLRGMWRTSRQFRIASSLLGVIVAAYLVIWATSARTLPSADSLLTYQPPLPSMVRGVNGEIVYSYARERRIQLRFVDFPKPVINAFLSAEDKTFWSHGGIDYLGFVGAVVDYAAKFGSGARARGGSTITQQVAKNILIGNEYSVTRKIKEMIVARRIEGVLNKQQILELYLNEIPLGRQAFGVQAASQAYFGKDVDQLDLGDHAGARHRGREPARFIALARRVAHRGHHRGFLGRHRHQVVLAVDQQVGGHPDRDVHGAHGILDQAVGQIDRQIAGIQELRPQPIVLQAGERHDLVHARGDAQFVESGNPRCFRTHDMHLYGKRKNWSPNSADRP